MIMIEFVFFFVLQFLWNLEGSLYIYIYGIRERVWLRELTASFYTCCFVAGVVMYGIYIQREKIPGRVKPSALQRRRARHVLLFSLFYICLLSLFSARVKTLSVLYFVSFFFSSHATMYCLSYLSHDTLHVYIYENALRFPFLAFTKRHKYKRTYSMLTLISCYQAPPRNSASIIFHDSSTWSLFFFNLKIKKYSLSFLWSLIFFLSKKDFFNHRRFCRFLRFIFRLLKISNIVTSNKYL